MAFGPRTSAPIENGERPIEPSVLPAPLLALVSVARQFGLHLDAARILHDNRLGNGPMSTPDLMRCAESAGLRALSLRPGWKGIIKLEKSLPAIVFLRDQSAMVLVSVDLFSAGGIVLEDPCTIENKVVRLGFRAFKEIWNGDITILKPTRILNDPKKPFNIGMILGKLFNERSMIRDICISAMMLSLLALTPILFFRVVSERILPYQAVSTFIVVGFVVTILVFFETAFGALRRRILLHLTARVDIQLSTEMFTRVLNLPVEYFERTPAGMTMHKMAQLGRVRSFLVGQLFGTVLDTGILLFFVPVMFFLSPILAVIVLISASAICGWIILMLPAYKLKSGAVEGAEAERGSFLAQSIQGIRTIKSLALEARQAHEWDLLTAKLTRLRINEGNLSNIIQSVVTPLERIMVMGSFGFGAYLAMRSTDPSDISTLLTFMLLSQRLAAPLVQASQLVSQFDEARTAIDVIGSLVNQPAERGRSGEGVRNELHGHIAFSGVQFQYTGAIKPALKNVTFEIPQGTTLGVMGRSGSGKTTITRLLQRLNSDYSGLVKIDGIDIRNYDLSHFRSSLGVVLQENFLFSGTIRSNITMAKPAATFSEMVQAARLAGAEEFIDKLPNGYETYVYEGSPNLSGGQRQRLAIARALITDPKILILDEATSALDAESEAIVNANIERISQGRTVITISHRLASLVKADAILVMEQGEVNDLGKHHELLERNEIYANLWYTQNPHTAAPTATRPQLTYKGPQSVA